MAFMTGKGDGKLKAVQLSRRQACSEDHTLPRKRHIRKQVESGEGKSIDGKINDQRKAELCKLTGDVKGRFLQKEMFELHEVQSHRNVQGEP